MGAGGEQAQKGGDIIVDSCTATKKRSMVKGNNYKK